LHADLATEADLEAVAEAGVCIMPTMTFMFNCLDYGSEIGVDQQEHDAIKRNVESCVTNMALAHKMGIKLLAGTDTGNSPITVHGESNLCEVELFRKHVGYSAMEAVMACTSDNAYAVGLEGEVGVIEAGKLADVIVLNGDPLSDIAVLQDPKKITTIIKDGKLVDRNASDMGLNIPPFELAEKHPTGTW
jgi:imidazolonepropionase-like amidohydrolase